MRNSLGVALVALTLAGCNLDVNNPQVIDAGSIDALADAETFSLSAQTDLFDAVGDVTLLGGFFIGEAFVGAARTQTNEIGRRVVQDRNPDLNDDIWAPVSLAIASNERVLRLLAGSPEEGSNVSVARSAMASGFGIVLMAETFCEGVIMGGPALTPEQALDSAMVRFNRAIEVGGAATGAEAVSIVNAARVGLARARLQKGENAEAAAAAAQVPPAFVYDAIRVDDPSNRGRLGNVIFDFTNGNSLVVPPAYRALNDPRVLFQDKLRKAQDSELDLFIQLKYPDFGAPIRIASGLEARYIAAEATLKTGNSAAALALIAERRAANGQGAFAGGTNAQVLAELLDQRAREFYLEAKHLGDSRRNPAATPYVPAAGTLYYKPAQGAFGSDTCFPIPSVEKLNNPNF